MGIGLLVDILEFMLLQIGSLLGQVLKLSRLVRVCSDISIKE